MSKSHSIIDLRIEQPALLVESQTLRFGFALLLETDLYALNSDRLCQLADRMLFSCVCLCGFALLRVCFRIVILNFTQSCEFCFGAIEIRAFSGRECAIALCIIDEVLRLRPA